VKPKRANISGLQLADILGHPVKQSILRDHRLVDTPTAPYAERVLEAIQEKYNRQLYDGRVEGYGRVLYPK
jgi:hypothetical protein